MKSNWKIWVGLAAVTYCVLAYIFMWPPVVTHIETIRTASACVNNLRQIDAAINQWALEKGKHSGDPVSLADLTAYIKLSSHGEIPGCPQGGKYSVTVVGQSPTCSLANTPYHTQIRVDWFHCEDFGPVHMVP